MVAILSGCSVLGGRQTIEEPRARELLSRAVSLVEAGRTDQLCTLSPFADSTCPDTLSDAFEDAPTSPPRILCGVALPDVGPLRGGYVLVVDGVDGGGNPYTAEFVVYDNGSDIGVLDAVYWAGLSVKDYGEDTVTWRFDSTSTACEEGALPGQEALVGPDG